ncbi:hypothetical protein THRCLA_22162 [Thraustotheca clavata]|uniref:Rab-GAP TBC domain-containing protein n=1 Tax=Thraustotheca clavata TaxID=74557 RepID=A0A1V9ZBB1_9STRA|nr:hypothetical protein THRCLA_22162 [Thraustotheca clavata]
MGFFEAIASSLESWLLPSVPRPTSAVVGFVPPTQENAVKKFKIDEHVYSSKYASTNTRRKSAITVQDDPIDEITSRFRTSLRMTCHAEWVAGQQEATRIKAVHAANLTEYARYLTELDMLDPKQQSGARGRTWKSIEQATLLLNQLHHRAQDLEHLSKGDDRRKLLQRIYKLGESIQAFGDDAIAIILREIRTLRAPMGSLRGGSIHVFEFLSCFDVVQCRLVSKTWLNIIDSKRLLSASFKSVHQRWAYWQYHLNQQSLRNAVPCYSYEKLVFMAESDVSNKHHLAINADVHRTTFVRAECLYTNTPSSRLGRGSSMSVADQLLIEELQSKLARMLKAYAQLDPATGYCHGMTFLGSTILSILGYDEFRGFQVFTACFYQHDLRHVFCLPHLPGALLRMYQFDSILRIHLPTVAKCLLKHKIHPQMYASGWIMALFLNEPSLTPYTIRIIVDDFITSGWSAMIRVYFGLVSVQAHQITTPHMSKTIQALAKLPKSLDSSLMAALEEGSKASILEATNLLALTTLAKHFDLNSSLLDYF